MYYTRQGGFTLIEMLVSLAVFAIVITMSVGTLLVLIGSNERLQDRQGNMSNLSFALDSMTRDIRTGTDYYCDNGNFSTHNAIVNGDDCKNGSSGVSFVEAGTSLTQQVTGARRVAFYHDSDTLWRRIGNSSPERMVASDIVVHDARFVVSGSERFSESDSDTDQPNVTIYLEASGPGVTSCAGADDRCVYIQTSVTQRTLDL